MYESAFKKLLASRRLADGYLLYGACELSLEVLRRELEDFYGPATRLFFTDTDYSHERAIDFLRTQDLFSAQRLLVLEISKDELRAFKLKELKNNCGDDAKLIVVVHTQKAQKAAEKDFGADFVRVFEKTSEHEQLTLLKEYARCLEVLAAPGDLAELARYFAGDVAAAGGELRKFAGGKLSLALCDFPAQQSGDFDALFEEIFRPNANFTQFKELLEGGEEIALMNKLAAAFLRLFKLSAYAKSHAAMDFSVALGYSPPPNVRKQLEKNALRCMDKYEAIFKQIIHAQNAIIVEAKDALAVILSLLVGLNLLIN